MKKNLFWIGFLWLLYAASTYGVTFNVTVPEGTKKCYVCGDFTGWSTGSALEMEKVGENLFHLDVPEVTGSYNFKYISGPDWIYVERDAAGKDIGNRTTATAMDVVGSWRNIYNPFVISVDKETSSLPHGITSRKIEIMVPDEYESNPGKSYPVIYMHGISQFYENSAADGDAKDNFFSANSWNIDNFMNQLAAAGKEPGIVVGIYGLVDELTPWENSDYLGSGYADQYLSFFVNEVIPFIEEEYRVLSGAENTMIMGADLGGLFTYYAGLQYPDKFGKVAVFSPSFWFTKQELANHVANWNKTTNQQYFFSVGELEGPEFTENTALFYTLTKEKGFGDSDISFRSYLLGRHNDKSWRSQFKDAYTYFTGQEALTSSYQFMSHSDATGTVCEGNKPFESSIYYSSVDASPSEVMVYVNVIPLDFLPAGTSSKNYNWGINTGSDCTGKNLVSSAITPVEIKNNRKAETWSRVIVKEDGTVTCIHASSEAFRVRRASDSSTDQRMTQVKADGTPGQDHTFTLMKEMDFGSRKNFKIRYGSPNSEGDMGALTTEMSVPDNCTRARITYCFLTNEVNIEVLEVENTPDDGLDLDYRFMSGSSSGSLVCDPNEIPERAFFYPSGDVDSETDVKVFIKEIPVTVGGTVYWNLNIGSGCSGETLTGVQNVKINEGRPYPSWIRAVIHADRSLSKIDAGSGFFRVFQGDNSTILNRTKADGTEGEDDSYSVAATISFPGKNKSFKVHYGSVNSGGDMGALTETLYVPDNCLKAQIIYSYKSNKVAVNVLETGEPTSSGLTSFQAFPAFCKEGTPVTIKASIANGDQYAVFFDVSHNYGTATRYAASQNESGEYVMELDDVKHGIYHISMTASQGNNELTGLPTISVKVPYRTDYNNVNKALTVNAYEGINWETIGKYKGNFHTHTSQSFDSSMSPDFVVDSYHSKDYKILALTDHDDNTYPWTMFSTFNPTVDIRNPEELGMLTFPGVELSKDNRNEWNMVDGTEFNHHNDFFTGRKGQEFATLEESYAYTEELSGLQIINHPGQYWRLDKSYESGEKNSPDWHANNFRTYKSLIGLEVYNQGNRRPNDRILWDQILDRTMPETPVWGYSCDDSHVEEHLFRNYQFMLMEELSLPALKDAMKNGRLYFSYEPGGTGDALAPRINNILVDERNKTITIDTPADEIYWICSTDLQSSSNPSGRKSTVVGYGKTFFYDGFQGSYVRAFSKNEYGETCTQPFGFDTDPNDEKNATGIDPVLAFRLSVSPNPAKGFVKVEATHAMEEIQIINFLGQAVKTFSGNGQESVECNLGDLPNGAYIVKVNIQGSISNRTLIINK